MDVRQTTKKSHRLTLLQQQGDLQELLQRPEQLQSRRNVIISSRFSRYGDNIYDYLEKYKSHIEKRQCVKIIYK